MLSVPFHLPFSPWTATMLIMNNTISHPSLSDGWSCILNGFRKSQSSSKKWPKTCSREKQKMKGASVFAGLLEGCSCASVFTETTKAHMTISFRSRFSFLSLPSAVCGLLNPRESALFFTASLISNNNHLYSLDLSSNISLSLFYLLSLDPPSIPETRIPRCFSHIGE